MTLYLDASALVKLYVAEAYSKETRRAVTRADQVAFAVVGYTEVRAAFARRQREDSLSSDGLREVVSALDADLDAFVRVGVSEGMAKLAGVLAEQYALRGFDAVHLAAALMLHRDRGDVAFLAFDDRLNCAAQAVMPVQALEDLLEED